MLGFCCTGVQTERGNLNELTPQALAPQLTIQIVGVRGLPQPKMKPGVSSLYCCAVRTHGDSEDFFQTRIIRDSLDPEWVEEVEMGETEFRQGLEFSILGADARGGIIHVGRASLPTTLISEEGWSGDLPLHTSTDAIAYLTVRIKSSGHDYPEDANQAFLMDVPPRQARQLGCSFDSHNGKSLCIMALKQGAVQDYNQNVKPLMKIGYLDHVVGVNQVEHDSVAMLKEIQTAPKLQLLVQRPRIFRATIAAPNQDTLGMRFADESSRGPWLIVREVIAGPPQHMRPVQLWNANHPTQSIRAGDRIVAVDGKQGRARELVKRMRRAATNTGGSFNVTVVQLGKAELEDHKPVAKQATIMA
mmetsp:Transcript_76652/g.151647  ORF Transcript_76652/g.151647 Transcript_76652/m.151647 type:complete len:360 (+) Transcript_76652:31-1110(+)